jgi:hypothetical protein
MNGGGEELCFGPASFIGEKGGGGGGGGGGGWRGYSFFPR